MRGVRKLACASLGFSAAVFAANYIVPVGLLYLLSALIAFISLLGFAFKGNTRLRIILILLSMSAGFAGYRLHYDNTVAVCNEYAGTSAEVSVITLDYLSERDYGNVLTARLCDDAMPAVKIRIYDYDKLLESVSPGDEIKLSLSFRSATERYNEEYDTNISGGIYLLAYYEGSAEYTYHEGVYLPGIPKQLGMALRQEIRAVFPEDGAAFLLALLTGDKTEYYLDDALYCSMSISGLAHVVAVSGMHVSFLVAFLQLILGKNRRSSLLCIMIIWIFVVMSGSSPSAVRAGFMLTVYLIAPIVHRENDRLTTLSFALAAILAQNPFACGSVSLQLSFAAIAGIFLFTQPIFDYIDTHTPDFGRAKLYINGALSNSVAVSVLTVPLSAVHFGYVGLLSPIANIMCLWAISVLFVGGYLICFLGFIANGAAVFLGGGLAYLVRYIAVVTKAIMKLPFSALFMENTYALIWIVLVYMLFAVSYLTRDRNRHYSPFLPTVLSIVSLAAVFLWTDAAMSRSPGTVSVMDVGNAQCICVTEGRSTSVIDCGSKGTMTHAGGAAAMYLKSQGRNRIDYLILTHLHTDHADGAVRLMNMTRVDTLVMPKNARENADEGLYEEILEAAEKNGVKLMFIDSDTQLSAQDTEFYIYAPFDDGDKNERGLMLTAQVGDKKLLVTGDASMATERKLVKSHDLSDTDILMVGHHGSRYSTSEELLQASSPQTAVISTGWNSYGHPTDEVLYRLAHYGIEILRTDYSGRITIFTGD